MNEPSRASTRLSPELGNLGSVGLGPEPSEQSRAGSAHFAKPGCNGTYEGLREKRDVIGTVGIEIFMEITCQKSLFCNPLPSPHFDNSSSAFWIL